MKSYALYLESGPRKQKTMVHVLDLLGCIAQGPTTDQAVAAAPEAIRAYLRFLKRHGESVDPDATFQAHVAEHITEGAYWLGNGTPAIHFKPDLEPLTLADAEPLIRRLAWGRADLIELVRRFSPAQLDASPGATGRALRAILLHVLESERFYVHRTLGRVDALGKAVRAAEKGEGDILNWLDRARKIAIDRIRALTPEERTQTVQHGQETWTARKMLRRMLEHEWEHFVEISDRLD